MKIALLILLSLAPLICGCRRPSVTQWDYPENAEYKHVSLVQLIAQPEKYHRRKVHVVGISRIFQDETALYLSELDARHRNNASGIWLELPKTLPDPRLAHLNLCSVDGVFDASRHGPMGRWPASIRDIDDFVWVAKSAPDEPAAQ